MSESRSHRLNALLRRAAAHRWVRRLEAYPFAIAFERVAIEEGLRAASAVGALLAVGDWLHFPGLSWAAFGAFWACLADPGGRDRSRISLIGLFAAAGTVAAFTASAAAGLSPLLGAAVLIPLVFVASLSHMYGVEASRVGTLVCVVAVVAVAFPSSPAAASRLAGLFLLGCAGAMILCIGIWRIHRYAPARRAIATVLAQLGSMASDLLALDQAGGSRSADWDASDAEHRRHIRATIERARAIVHGLETSDPRYRRELEIADRIFAALIAIGHAMAAHDASLAPNHGRDLIHRLLPLLAEAQHEAELRVPRPALLTSEAKVLQSKSSAVDNVIGRAIGSAAQALNDLADVWRGASVSAAAAEVKPQSASRVLKPIPATALNHATRVAIAVVTAYAVGSFLNLTSSYWATIAAVVVVQPDARSIWQRSVERMLGSIAGGALAALLMFALPMKGALLALVFPIATATIAFRHVNYTIFVLFATVLFVLVSELLQPAGGIAFVRALDNVIGSLIGFAASALLWRGQRVKPPGQVLADAVKANFAYAAGVMAATGTVEEVENLRRAAGLASNAAEAMRQRMALEGQSKRAHLPEMADLLRALRLLAGSMIAASLAGTPPDRMRASVLTREAAALADMIERPSARISVTAPAVESQGDIDRAIRSVTVAAAAYAGAFRA